MKPENVEVITEGNDAVVYISVGGKRVAKRDSDGRWTNLEPVYAVHGGEPGTSFNDIEVERLQ